VLLLPSIADIAIARAAKKPSHTEMTRLGIIRTESDLANPGRWLQLFFTTEKLS
jgi:hypothetical protein